MSERLETLSYGSIGLDAPDNFDEYVDFTRNYRFSRVDDLPFRARADFWRLDNLSVTEQVIGGNIADRPDDLRLATPADHYTVLAIFDGRIDYRSDTKAMTCASGDVALLDYRRAFRLVTPSPGQHSATVSLPRAVLQDRLGPVSIEGRFPRTAETRMLLDFVRTLVGQLPDMAVASTRPIASVVRHLLLLALQSGEPGSATPSNGDARARAVAYIRARPPGTLAIAPMIDALGTTRATLYRLFRQDGGVLAYDRRRRLRLLHQDLCEAPRSVSLRELGARHGFDDLPALARLFRACFGHSMSKVRDHLPVDQTSRTNIDTLRRYRDAVEGLSRV